MNYLLFLYLIKSFSLYPGDQPCQQLSVADCTQSKYCLWDASKGCLTQLCHLVDEIAACRSGGALFTQCKAVSYTPPQFAQSCQQVSLTSQRIYYYRFISDLSPDQISSTEATYLSLSSLVPSIGNLKQLYTLDILSRARSQLQQILNLYLSYESVLVQKPSHPYYIERTIYEALQNTRDDISQTWGERNMTLIKIWKLVDILYKRLETFSDIHQTNYNFINFNHIHLKYLKLETDIATVSWDQYQNAYLRMTVFYGEIYGLISPVSPVFVIKTSDGQILDYKLKWQLSTSLPIKLKQVDLLQRQVYDSYIRATCSAGYCEASLTGAGSYVFTVEQGEDCAQITTRDVCYIALCTWDYSSSKCI